MTTFWIAISLLFVFALVIVWYAFLSKNSPTADNDNDIRRETNISLYHEHLQELKNDFSEGAIDQESFEQLEAELNKTLLQDVNASDDNTKKTKKSTLTSIFWPVGTSILIGVISFYTYFEQGSSDLIAQPIAAVAADPHANLSREQMALLKVQQLQNKVSVEPENSQAWFSLGHAFMSVGEYDNSVKAFDQVISLIGEHAELIGPKAQALYYKNNQQINEEIQVLVDKALSLDPVDASTNILLGMDTYAKHEFEKAIQHWQKVLDSGRPGINTQALVGAINEARSQIQVANDMASGPSPAQSTMQANEPKLTIDLSFSQDVIAQLMADESKTVFVYATATNGPRMPLAAVKIYASEIPTKLVLDNSLAMTPQNNLSSVDKVNIYAVVSMQGGVGIKPGDFKAELLNFDVNNKDVIKLTIDTLVK